MKDLSPKGINSQAYHVTAFGAVGDNSTNDRTKLQAAIDAVPSTGGTILFPPGTFVIDNALNIKSNVKFQGAGLGVTTIRLTSTTATALAGTDIAGFVMADMGLQGPNSGTGTGLKLARSVSANTRYIDLKNVYIRQFGQDGIDVSNSIVSSYENVNCENNGRYGFYFHGDSGVAGTSTTFQSCYANTNTTAGFNIDTMAYSTLTGCAAQGSPTNFLLSSCQGVTLNACGSEAMSSGGTGFKVNAGFGVKLDGCFDLTNRGKAFWFTGSHLNGTIQNCTEQSPGAGATASFQVDSGSKVMFLQNSYTTAIALNGLAPQFMGSVGFANTVFLGASSDAYFYRNAANEIGTDGFFVQNGGNPTATNHTATKGYVDGGRRFTVPFFISGSVTTGVKTPEFIAPVAMTIIDMYGRLNAGTGTTTIRPSKNGGTTDGSTLNVTTASGHTAQTLSLAAGDRLTVNVTAVGTSPSDLSVTFLASF